MDPHTPPSQSGPTTPNGVVGMGICQLKSPVVPMVPVAAAVHIADVVCDDTLATLRNTVVGILALDGDSVESAVGVVEACAEMLAEHRPTELSAYAKELSREVGRWNCTVVGILTRALNDAGGDDW